MSLFLNDQVWVVWPALGAAGSGLRELRSLSLREYRVPAMTVVGWVAELPLEHLTVGRLHDLDAASTAALERSPTLRVVEFTHERPERGLIPSGFRLMGDAWVRQV